MRIGGRYVVDKILGAGGMGVVALARYPELQQKVAIKFLLPMHAANEVLNTRFVREARLAARVKSEHFVRVFDIGKLPNGVPYLVMELLSGRDLSDELDARGALSVEQAIDVVLQATVGIAEIHALGVVHRDLKPSNLFLAEAAGKRSVKVLDFGISKENIRDATSQLTSTDNLLGTPQYMSPEQVRASRDVDARSDIWALGVILYELLTAQRPFVSPENSVGELFAKVLYADPPPPRQHRPDLPEGLEAVVLRCLARERDARFADVGQFADALLPFAAPVSELRVGAVHQALLARESMVPSGADDPDFPPASRVPTAALPQRSVDPAFAATSASNGMSLDGARAPAAGSGGSAPVTAMTSSRSSNERDAKRGGRSVLLLGIGAAVALAGVGTFVFISKTKLDPAKDLSSTATIVPASPSAAPAAMACASAKGPNTPTTTSVPATEPAPTTSPSAPVTKNVAAHPVVAPRARGATAPATPPAPAPAPVPAPTSPSDLILDRK